MKSGKDNSGKFNLMFVCTGNICRSPMAVGILRRLLPEGLRDAVAVSSSGTSAYPGSPASNHAVEVCRRSGADIRRHRARPTDRRMVADADLILVMEPQHLDYIAGLDLTACERAFLLKEYKRDTGYQGEKSVRDPISGDISVYESVFADLTREIERILPALKETLRARKERAG